MAVLQVVLNLASQVASFASSLNSILLYTELAFAILPMFVALTWVILLGRNNNALDAIGPKAVRLAALVSQILTAHYFVVYGLLGFVTARHRSVNLQFSGCAEIQWCFGCPCEEPYTHLVGNAAIAAAVVYACEGWLSGHMPTDWAETLQLVPTLTPFGTLRAVGRRFKIQVATGVVRMLEGNEGAVVTRFRRWMAEAFCETQKPVGANRVAAGTSTSDTANDDKNKDGSGSESMTGSEHSDVSVISRQEVEDMSLLQNRIKTE
jgi:hypothetical protein